MTPLPELMRVTDAIQFAGVVPDCFGVLGVDFVVPKGTCPDCADEESGATEELLSDANPEVTA